MKRAVCAVNETSGKVFYKRKHPLFIHLNLSPSVIWRLVLSWMLLTAWEWWLLVACWAAGVLRRWIWGGVVIGWVSIVLVKLADTLAIPSIREVGQKCLLRLILVSKSNFYATFWKKISCSANMLSAITWYLLVKCCSMWSNDQLTQVMMEKKEKVRTARAASLELVTLEVFDHWLVRTQKQMNHRNVQVAVSTLKCQSGKKKKNHD